MAKGRLVDAEGDPQQAIALLDEAERLYRPGFFPDVRPIAGDEGPHLDRPGRPGGGRRVGPAARGVGHDDAGYLGEYDQLTLVRLLVAQHQARPDPGAADQSLGGALDQAPGGALDRASSC